MFKEFTLKLDLTVFNSNNKTFYYIMKFKKNKKFYNSNIFFSKKIEHNFKSKILPTVQIFQKLNKATGFNFFKNFHDVGVLKHINNGFINKVFFPTSSKRRNVKTLNKLSTFVINFLIQKIKKKMSTISFISNTVYKNLLENNNFFNIKYPNRLKKKKRSLQRRSRKKIFRSKYGRIWITNK